MFQRLHLIIRAYRKRLKSRYRGETELALLPLLVKGGLAIDVGANKGVYTYFLSRICDRVVAYEPNPELAAKISGYGLKNVEVLNAALSDNAGTANLNIPLSKAGKRRNNVASLNTLSEDSDAIAVEVRKLDDEGHQAVSFIKIDVEGHEGATLAGAEALIRRDRPAMLVEINGGPDTPHAREIISRIEGWGYVVLQHFRGVLTHVTRLDPSAMAGRDRNYICLPTERAGQTAS